MWQWSTDDLIQEKAIHFLGLKDCLRAINEKYIVFIVIHFHTAVLPKLQICPSWQQKKEIYFMIFPLFNTLVLLKKIIL